MSQGRNTLGRHGSTGGGRLQPRVAPTRVGPRASSPPWVRGHQQRPPRPPQRPPRPPQPPRPPRPPRSPPPRPPPPPTSPRQASRRGALSRGPRGASSKRRPRWRGRPRWCGSRVGAPGAPRPRPRRRPRPRGAPPTASPRAANHPLPRWPRVPLLRLETSQTRTRRPTTRTESESEREGPAGGADTW